MNAFSLKLMQYLIENHPDMITDIEFIEERGKKALYTFAQSSRNGLSVQEAFQKANHVLYEELHFSSYCLVKEIVEDNRAAKQLKEEEKDVFIMKMWAYTKDIINLYMEESGEKDNFISTDNYTKAYSEITNIINQYIINNGL